VILQKASERGISWFLWRVVAAPQVPDGLHTVRHLWTFVDLLEAHHYLDAVRDLAAID
jgi:hypothetical protein